jgi:hypothetical protein
MSHPGNIFGYTDREGAFIETAVTVSGYVLPRQFNYFVGKASGAITQAFFAKLLRNNHASVSVHARNAHLYHIYSRPLYAALGQEDNRNRRKRPADEARIRLMHFDFRLHNQAQRYIDSERERVGYFTSLGFNEAVLPKHVYRSKNGPLTVRYFVDKAPVWLGPNGEVSFGFISGDSPSQARFERFLSEYGSLFAQLRRFHVVFVTSRPELAAQGERRFFACVQKSPTRDAEVYAFFRLRVIHEAGRTAELTVNELRILRAGLARYKSDAVETQYHDWKLRGDQDGIEVKPSFSSFILPYSYDLFGDLSGLKNGRE